jgi:hypothetical protein
MVIKKAVVFVAMEHSGRKPSRMSAAAPATDRHVAGRGARKKIDVIERSEDYERGRTRDEVLTKLRSPGPYPPDRP